MTLVLNVARTAWDSHVNRVADSVRGLIPVVKGNGYGFGRDWLASRAAPLASILAVGTADEVSSVPADRTPMVLTPLVHPRPGLRSDAILTVGSPVHVSVAAGHRVVVKVRSSMNRYGCDPGEVADLVRLGRSVGCEVMGLSIHPPLVGGVDDHVREIADIVGALDSSSNELSVWVSHIDGKGLDELRRRFPAREWFLRLGTALWHGDKSMLQLRSDVIDVRSARAGDVAGYRLTRISEDGRIVMIGCGTAHGIAPLDGGLSPFHHDRRRLPLLEAPHMHTSMVFVGRDSSCPEIGDMVDVQRPLISTLVDRVDWV